MGIKVAWLIAKVETLSFVPSTENEIKSANRQVRDTIKKPPMSSAPLIIIL